jgi:hypothetical protein
MFKGLKAGCKKLSGGLGLDRSEPTAFKAPVILKE